MATFTLNRPKFILFGDSLTQRSMSSEGGWGAALAHNYGRKADVVIRGYGGYNTRGALPMLDSIFEECTPSSTLLVTIFFGANDSVRTDGPP
eukprot:gene6097-2694_t